MKKAMIIFSLLFAGSICAQNAFMKVILGNEGLGRAIDRHSNGDVSVAATYVDSTNFQGLHVVRSNGNGTMIWSSVLSMSGGIGMPLANDISTTADGGMVVGGEHVLGLAEDSAFIVKIDANGNVEWAKRFSMGAPGVLSSRVERVTEADNGDIIVLGQSTILSGGVSQEIFVTRLNASGNEIWTKTLSTNIPGTINRPGDVISFSTGNILVTGRSTQGVEGSWTTAIDANGNILWSNLYETNAEDIQPKNIFKTNDGYELFQVRASDVVDGHCFQLTLDEFGSLLSVKKFDVNGMFGNIRYIMTPDSTFILVGDFETSPGNKDVVQIKLDYNGQPVWAKSYGSGGNEAGVALTWTNDGGTMTFATADKDSILNVDQPFWQLPWLIKADDQGHAGDCEENIPNVSSTPFSFNTGSITQTPADVTGWANATFVQTTPYNEQYVCGTQVSVPELDQMEMKVYPNPSSGLLRIECSERINSISIYSVLGELVLEMNNATVIDIGELPQGWYALKARTANGWGFTKAVLKK